MDDLTRIEGIGPATAKRLVAAGLDSFEKLAHDGLAGQHGIKVEWISAAAGFLHAGEDTQDTQEKPPRSDDEPEAHVDDRAGLQADTGAGDPDKNTPRGSSGTAREASSTDGGTTASSPDQGPGPAPSVGAQPGSPNGPIETAVAEAVATWPRLFAASEGWKAAHPDTLPTVIRISAKVDGFRRAGMAHTKAPVDHPVGTFDADQIEQLLGEPNLAVEFA